MVGHPQCSQPSPCGFHPDSQGLRLGAREGGLRRLLAGCPVHPGCSAFGDLPRPHPVLLPAGTRLQAWAPHPCLGSGGVPSVLEAWRWPPGSPSPLPGSHPGPLAGCVAPPGSHPAPLPGSPPCSPLPGVTPAPSPGGSVLAPLPRGSVWTPSGRIHLKLLHRASSLIRVCVCPPLVPRKGATSRSILPPPEYLTRGLVHSKGLYWYLICLEMNK